MQNPAEMDHTYAYPSARPTNGQTVIISMACAESGKVDGHHKETAGYMISSDDPVALMKAVRTMQAGGTPDPESVIGKVRVQVRPELQAPPHELSPRETDVLRALVRGLSYKMIAHELGITYETVRTHIKRIYSKMRVCNNTEAVAKALNEHVLV